MVGAQDVLLVPQKNIDVNYANALCAPHQNSLFMKDLHLEMLQQSTYQLRLPR